MGTSNVQIVERTTVNITGLKTIISTSTNECVFCTTSGTLKINGTCLVVSALDLTAGTITLTGTIWGVNYTSI